MQSRRLYEAAARGLELEIEEFKRKAAEAEDLLGQIRIAMNGGHAAHATAEVDLSEFNAKPAAEHAPARPEHKKHRNNKKPANPCQIS